MLAGWKIGSGRLFGDKAAPTAPPPHPSLSLSSPPLPSPPLSSPPLPSPLLSDQKSGLFASAISAITSIKHQKPAVRDDPEFDKLVSQFSRYSARVGAVLSAVEGYRSSLASLINAHHNLTAAANLLQAPLDSDECQDAPAEVAELMPLWQCMQSACNELLCVPLQTVLASHAELQNRIAEREKQHLTYEKAALSFAKLQKQAAKTSRKNKHKQSRESSESSGGIRSTLTAAWGKMGSRNETLPDSSPAHSEQASLDDTGETLDSDEEASAEKDTECSEGMAEDTITEDNSKIDRLKADRHTDKRIQAASNLAALLTAKTVITDVLKEKLKEAVDRKATVADKSRRAAERIQCFTAQGMYSAVQDIMPRHTDIRCNIDSLAAFASDANSMLEEGRTRAQHEGCWYDEGAAARASTRARAIADRQQQRRRLELTAASRRVRLDASLSPLLVELPSRHASTQRVLSTPDWLGHIASYLSVGDVGRMGSACKAWRGCVSEHSDLWLATLRSGSLWPHQIKPCAKVTTASYIDHVRCDMMCFNTSANHRLRMWKRALGVDGGAAPAWSCTRQYAAARGANIGSHSSTRPVNADEFNALVHLARAESADGAKQDVNACQDGDLVYLNEDEESACRWSIMIEQDVLRTYADGSSFGVSSAVLRALRVLDDRNEDAAGNPRPCRMSLFMRRPSSEETAATTVASATELPSTSNASGFEMDTADAVPSDDLDHRRSLLRMVLLATAASEPELRYTQGMCSVARLLLELCIAAEVEEPAVEAFNLLAALLRLGSASMHRPGFPDPVDPFDESLVALYAHDSKNARLRLATVERLLARHLPDVARPLINEHLAASAYGSSWFLTLFSNFSALPVSAVAILWDCFIVGGWPEMMDAFLSILSSMRDALEGQPMEELLRRLHAPVAFACSDASQQRFLEGSAAGRMAQLRRIETEIRESGLLAASPSR